MTFGPIRKRRKVVNAAERLRRRREAVERLRELAARDGVDSIYADLLPEAERRLAECSPVVVGDHAPEPRAAHATFGPSDPARWIDCPGALDRLPGSDGQRR